MTAYPASSDVAPNSKSWIHATSAIDIASAFRDDPPPLDFVIPGFLAGTVGALIAPGATGKSFFALEAAMGVACNLEITDLLGLRPEHHGPVLYLAAEDPKPALTMRLHAVGRHLNSEARAAIAENLTIIPIMGAMVNLLDQMQRAELITRCDGVRLVILDTLSRVHVGDENSNGEMARLISVLEHIAASTSAAILYLHHSSKAAVREGQTDQQQAARGASALIDNARWAGFLARMTEGEAEEFSIAKDMRSLYLRFGVSKQNYAVLPPERWLKRHEGGVLLPADLPQKGRGGFRD